MNDRDECVFALRQNLSRIQNEFGVTSMSMFGSIARGEGRIDSDVDIFVEMPPKIFLLSKLKIFLESILNKTVDIVRRHSHMSDKFLDSISQDAIRIF